MAPEDQFELLKMNYLSNVTKYTDAIKHYRLGNFSELGAKSDLAKLHHDMIMSCFPLFDMIAKITVKF